MDFTSDHKAPKTQTQKHDVPSTTELMSSAKIVADAARASLNNESDKLDKAKLADAAEDLLEAASHYGKLEENQNFGKYVQQAEDYLHNYKTTSTITTTTTTHSIPTDSSHSSVGGGDSHSGGSGGYGDYIKMAEGLFDKHNPTTTTTSHSTTTTHPNPIDSSHSSGGGGGHPTSTSHSTNNTHSSGEGGDGHSGSGGYGEYIKMAEGFLKKH